MNACRSCYTFRISPLFALSFPQQIKKVPHPHSSSVHWGELRNCIWPIVRFVSIELKCSDEYKLYIFIMKGKFIFFMFKNNILSQMHFQKKQNKISVFELLSTACLKRHGINLKCQLLLWPAKLLCPFLKSSEHIKRQSSCSEATYMNSCACKHLQEEILHNISNEKQCLAYLVLKMLSAVVCEGNYKALWKR